MGSAAGERCARLGASASACFRSPLRHSTRASPKRASASALADSLSCVPVANARVKFAFASLERPSPS
jgi:hypothetical protein